MLSISIKPIWVVGGVSSRLGGVDTVGNTTDRLEGCIWCNKTGYIEDPTRMAPRSNRSNICKRCEGVGYRIDIDGSPTSIKKTGRYFYIYGQVGTIYVYRKPLYLLV